MKIIFLTISKRIPLFLTCLLILFTGETVLAQTYTLQQVLDSIEKHNPGLQQFSLKTKSSNDLEEAAKAWSAPQVGVGVSEFPYNMVNKSSTGMSSRPRKMLMLRLQQMFPNFSKQKKEAAYYQSFVRQNQDDKETMQNMLFARAKTAYYDAYIAEKKLSLINEQTIQLQLLIRIAEGRLAYNKVILPNIYKARAKLSELQSSKIKISSVASQSASILNSLMARSADAPLQIDTSENIERKQVNILQVDSAYVLRHRSDILHTADKIHSMELKKEISSTMSKPAFGITWDNMRMNSGMYMYNAMAMVSIPIVPWFSKGYKSKISSIDYQIQSVQKIRDNQVLETLGNIRKDWLSLQAARKDLHIFQEGVIPAYAKTYQSYLNAFSENTGDIYETLMAWNELTMKKMEYYDKLSDMLNIQVMLETELQQY